MTTCPFCLIAQGEDHEVLEVARNGKVVVFFPKNPASLGHCLAIPVRHVESFSDLTDDEVDAVMLAAKATSKAVSNAIRPHGLNIIQSNGSAASQSVPHVHVHIVPRWNDDNIGEFWPPKSEYSPEDKKRILAKLRASTMLESTSTSAEDRRQHLSFIQSVISRMAQSSASAKSWLLPVVSATYGYSATKHSLLVAMIGILAVMVFGGLDTEYLRVEREYRKLYERVASQDRGVEDFSMKVDSLSFWAHLKENCSTFLRSWSLWPFYTALTLVGCGLLAWMACSHDLLCGF